MGLDETATYHVLDDADITNTRYYANSETLTGIGITNFFLASGDLYSSFGDAHLVTLIINSAIGGMRSRC